jgi:hypothetical protein
MKKRKLLISAVFVCVVGFIPACDFLEECGRCKLVTENADGTVTEGAELPYCGDALAEKQNSSPVTVGGVTTYWDCY